MGKGTLFDDLVGGLGFVAFWTVVLGLVAGYEGVPHIFLVGLGLTAVFFGLMGIVYLPRLAAWLLRSKKQDQPVDPVSRLDHQFSHLVALHAVRRSYDPMRGHRLTDRARARRYRGRR